ncbi:DMSO/selenate family reductase complex A subunit [Trueperella bialowiezensis]|uniref:Dimethyl sulfoxide reductase DmsA n=1 Tax=Trueperella bialowiezensis TaxID=312285 RepID=A0A448PF29_9ACTO|nr:DMSO/selenate family reductase complex A subunit [Trueperella bialowiezensis]VEI13549.1 Dimethyl sulfoxide reductase DmsA precursor [Trueperella bialowiezensis]
MTHVFSADGEPTGGGTATATSTVPENSPALTENTASTSTSVYAGATAPTGPSRRTFLKWSGVAAGVAGLAATTSRLGSPTPAHATPGDGYEHADKTVWSACAVNCGARCPLRLQVREGHVVRVLPDNTGGDTINEPWRIPACPRGRSIRHRIYNPDRLKTPLKRREGTPRGGGQWEEISWEQAFDEIAQRYQDALDKYGPESIFPVYGTGAIAGIMHNSYTPYVGAVGRLFNLKGGFLGYYGDYSTGGITEAMRLTLGGYFDSHSSDDLKNTRLHVLWGHSPLETKMSGGSEAYYLHQFRKENSVKTWVVDPRHSDTAALLADEWVALRPGTDAALVAGIAHVLISENLHDQEFLDTHALGFDEEHLPDGAPAGSSYRAYIEGKGPDKTEKTPKWAEAITGVPAETIINFARDLGANKPSMIQQGWGPQRHANGENSARAVITLNAMLGNVGVPGGGLGTMTGSAGLSIAKPFWDVPNGVTKMISHFSWLDAVENGEAMGASQGVRDWDADGNPIRDAKLDTSLKFLFVYGSNMLINQNSDINRAKKVLEDTSLAETIVVVENQWTSSCDYGDYVLPGTMNTEETDLILQGMSANMGYSILASQAMEPLYESKSIYEICSEIAHRVGVGEQYTEGRTQEEWVRELVRASRELTPELPDYETFKEQGVYKTLMDTSRTLVEFAEDPVANPLDTPSGLIEIYSPEAAWKAENWDLPEGDVITALPEFIHTWEDVQAASTNPDYPLTMIGYHFKGRTHSSYGNVDWLREAHHQVAWINPIDAEARGIADGDTIDVFNPRGRIRLFAKVTHRIVPGTITVPEGAWYKPDDDQIGPEGTPIDMGGNPNTLTSLRPSALAKTNAQYTNNVQVERAAKQFPDGADPFRMWPSARNNHTPGADTGFPPELSTKTTYRQTNG